MIDHPWSIYPARQRERETACTLPPPLPNPYINSAEFRGIAKTRRGDPGKGGRGRTVGRESIARGGREGGMGPGAKLKGVARGGREGGCASGAKQKRRVGDSRFPA